MTFGLMRAGRTTAVFIVLLSIAGPALPADCPTYDPGRQTGTVQSGAVTEASGLAASRRNDGVLWTHNDSGDSARAFAMDTQGKHLGAYTLSGANALDWEDMAVGPGPTAGTSYLYLGDIGDNASFRGSVKVYRVAEPSVSVGQPPVSGTIVGAESITLRYPDGP